MVGCAVNLVRCTINEYKYMQNGFLKLAFLDLFVLFSNFGILIWFKHYLVRAPSTIFMKYTNILKPTFCKLKRFRRCGFYLIKVNYIVSFFAFYLTLLWRGTRCEYISNFIHSGFTTFSIRWEKSRFYMLDGCLSKCLWVCAIAAVRCFS